MRPAFADFSPTVPATFAVGIGIALSVFLLPAGVVDKGPTPTVPAFGEAAGHVVADLPVARARASEARKAASAHPQVLVALRPPTAKARQVHHQARAAVVRHAPPAPVRAVARTTRKTPVAKAELFSIPQRGKGKARGHGPKWKAAKPKPSPLAPGRGKALGRSNEHQDRLPPGLAKKASPATAPGPPPRPRGNGGGNGRKGNDGGNEGHGHGGGNGRKWEND
jgi:hypothetical protein